MEKNGDVEFKDGVFQGNVRFGCLKLQENAG